MAFMIRGKGAERGTWGALLFLALFGLLFAAGGVWALTGVPGKWAHGDSRDGLALATAGLAFALVGFGLMASAAVGRRGVGAEAKAAWEHPDEPWKWRPDWAAGYAQGEGRRAGTSRFDLAAVPVPVGRTLAGSIRTRLMTPPAGGFALTLSALRITRGGAADDRSARVVWQEAAQVFGQLAGGPDGLRVVAPVAIRIPADAPGTDHSAIDDEVVWRLEARAAEPGVDYRATFELPIYRTAESDQAESARTATHLRAVSPLPPGAMIRRAT